jgi:hypothetical protein
VSSDVFISDAGEDLASGEQEGFSLLALVSTLLAGLSALSLLQPFLLSLGIIAAALGTVCLLKADDWGLGRISRVLAFIGLTVSVFFVGWVAIESRYFHSFVVQEGKNFVEEYAKVVQSGDMDKAYMLTLDLETYIQLIDPRAINAPAERSTFDGNPVYIELKKTSGMEGFRFAGVRSIVRSAKTTKVVLAFEQEGVANPRTIRATLIRFPATNGTPRDFAWRMSSFDFEQ